MDLASFKQLSKAKMTGTLQGVRGLRIAGNKIDLIKRWGEHMKMKVCFTALYFTGFSLNERRPRNNQRLRSPDNAIGFTGIATTREQEESRSPRRHHNPRYIGFGSNFRDT
jgi:hypothetical protein